MDKVFSMLKKPEKTFYKKFAQLNGCCYICNHLVANYMRRDVFRAIAYPSPRAYPVSYSGHGPNALAEHFDSARQAVSKYIMILTECEVVTQKQFNPEKMEEADIWLERFRKMWENRFDQLDSLLKDL